MNQFELIQFKIFKNLIKLSVSIFTTMTSTPPHPSQRYSNPSFGYDIIKILDGFNHLSQKLKLLKNTTNHYTFTSTNLMHMIGYIIKFEILCVSWNPNPPLCQLPTPNSANSDLNSGLIRVKFGFL